jgi:hypothetical protein
LELDNINFAQQWLDTAVSWDKDGRDSAFQAVARVAPFLSNQWNDAIVWIFCQRVLHSRGVFLHDDKSKCRELIEMLQQSSDGVVPFLAAWYEASKQCNQLAGMVIP